MISLRKAVLTAGVAVACTASLTAGLVLPAQPTPGNIRFFPLEGLCGNGETAYYGLLEPSVVTEPDEYFVEVMGGAVCFNKTSCEDSWLGAWLGITSYLKSKLGLDDGMIAYLQSGQDVPLSLLAPLKPGYLPFDSSHPLSGRRGIYFPTCTADVSMGRHNVTYEDDFQSYHHGGKNFLTVLNAVKAAMPDITRFSIYGGSGGGVAASVWMTRIADMWPSAQVMAFVDSGFHMMPGGEFFNFFWDNVKWSPGPGGDIPGRYDDIDLPDFDWRHQNAISAQLHKYDGRVKIMYIACTDDYIVFGDRARMSQYSVFDGDTIQQMPEMWDFLTNLHKCAPAGSAFSYIANCSQHHMSRDGWPEQANIPGMITMKAFAENVLQGLPPDSEDTSRTHFWYEDRSIEDDGTTCSTEVGLTPTPAPPTPAPAPTPAPTSPTPAPSPSATLSPSPAPPVETKDVSSSPPAAPAILSAALATAVVGSLAAIAGGA